MSISMFAKRNVQVRSETATITYTKCVRYVYGVRNIVHKIFVLP
jgi:hypothetical protein